MKIATWNVNGIRAVVKKEFFVERVKKNDFDIFCLQEPKAFEHQLPAIIKKECSDYDYVWHRGERAGYAGTVIFYKKGLKVQTQNEFPGYEQLSIDGRTTSLQIDDTMLINCYFPNGGTRADGTEMLTYKLRFYDTISTYVQECQDKGLKVILTGDFNICHTEIDIARPKQNAKSIGFLPIERERIGQLLEERKLTDTFRHFYPGKVDCYPRWSYRAGARARNVGRRLDCFFCSENIMEEIISCEHQDQQMGSDHCPVVLELKD